MVDLKDRINKPRILRGTPSYAFVTRISAIALLVTSFTGLCIGFHFYRKERTLENYGKATYETIIQDIQEEKVKRYVEGKKREMRYKQALKDEEEYFP